LRVENFRYLIKFKNTELINVMQCGRHERMSKNSSKIQLTAKYKQALEEPTKARRAKEIIVYLNLLVEEARKIKK